jgi:hypothetical protein
MAKKTTTRPPSKTALLEMQLRKEEKFSPSWRLASLLTAMSHLRKHTYMTEAEMANQLKLERRQIEDSLKYLLALDHKIFDKKAPKGVHRPNQYHRHLLPHETPSEFVYRVQSHPKMDLCYGMHWVSIDGAKDTGVAEFSAHKIWPNRSEEAFRQARRKMNELGYFTVDPASDRSRPTRYILNKDRFATAEAEHDIRKRTEQVNPKPTWTTKQEKREREALAKQAEARRQREADEQARQRKKEEHEKRLAESEGVSLAGETQHAIHARPGNSSKSGKRVISFEPSVGKAKAKIDENDL